jgi:hypothetical protein
LEKVEKGVKQMNHQMDKENMKFWLFLAIMIIVAILMIFWIISIYWFPRFPFRLHERPPENIPGDIEFFYMADGVVSMINIALLISLLIIYIDIYMKTRSEFTIGLIIFSAVFLLNAIASSPVVAGIFGFQASGLGPFILLPDLFTSAALIVLLYLSVKY